MKHWRRRIPLFLLFAIQLSRTECFGSQIECVAGCGRGPETQAGGIRLSEPFATAFDAHGNLYICEYGAQRITLARPLATPASATVSLAPAR